MRQLTGSLFGGVITQFSKLPMRQLTPNVLEDILIPLSKLPMRQLTPERKAVSSGRISKLPMRQLTVVFCANILMLLKLAAGYSYLTKILGSCQNP